MTEEEWESWTDPRDAIDAMLGSIRIRSPVARAFTDRKAHLFAVACCRRVEDRWNDSRVRAAVEATEQHADARTNEEHKRIKPVRIHIRRDPVWARTPIGLLTKAVTCNSGWTAARNSSWWAGELFGHSTTWAVDERIAQGPLLRDIIGNPFRPVKLLRKWRTDTVLTLAKQMYESRDFGAMPILADALQDAGCDNDDILNHCRAESVHVRGCWVVDLVLGKS